MLAVTGYRCVLPVFVWGLLLCCKHCSRTHLHGPCAEWCHKIKPKPCAQFPLFRSCMYRVSMMHSGVQYWYPPGVHVQYCPASSTVSCEFVHCTYHNGIMVCLIAQIQVKANNCHIVPSVLPPISCHRLCPSVLCNWLAQPQPSALAMATVAINGAVLHYLKFACQAAQWAERATTAPFARELQVEMIQGH